MSYKPNQQDIQSALMNHGGSDGSAITNFQWDQLQYQFTYNDENKTGTVVVTPIATCIQYSGSVTVSFNWVN
jgi:predicted Abi (CAAX) family protease